MIISIFYATSAFILMNLRCQVKMPEVKMPEVKISEVKMSEVKMPEVKMQAHYPQHFNLI